MKENEECIWTCGPGGVSQPIKLRKSGKMMSSAKLSRRVESFVQESLFLVSQVVSLRIGNRVQVQAINSKPPFLVDRPHPKYNLPFIASTFQVGDFTLVAVDFLFTSSFQQARSSFASKFRVELRRQAQVDNTSLLPVSIELEVIEHVKSVQRGLTCSSIYR